MAIKFDTFKTGGAASGVTSVNGDTGPAVTLSGDDIAADHTASNYTAANANIDGHLSGIDTKLGTIAAGLTYKGSYNASTNSPALTNALQGDLYVVSAAGTQFGVDWQIGDHLLVNADMGGTIDNSKIDKIDNTEPAASETVAGIIEIATNAEAALGAATNRALVPSNISSLDLSTMDNSISGFISSVASASETVQGIIEIATNAEAAAATATDKALVPSNISSLDLADMDNTTAGFIAGITSESLNDLSDVQFTAGAPINNYVLTYDHSNTQWEAKAAASGGLSEIVQDTTPQLGGPLDVNGQEITSASNGNVAINPNGSGDISIGADLIPDADATHTIGDEDNRYISIYSDLNGAIRFKAKNNQGAAITKGQVVYISGVSGTVPEVKLARANSSATMPAFGLAQANANDQAEVEIVTFGNLTDYDTTTYSLSANDTVFVSAATAGALTNTAPTGEANLIQNIGRVVRADASAGIIKVGGAGRSNATPNLNQDKIFLGNASNQAVATALSSVALSSFNDDLNYLSNISEDPTPQLGANLDVNGQDIVSVSNGDIEFAANGTGTVKITPTTSGGHLVLQGDGTNSGKVVLNCELNSHGVTIEAPPHSATASYTLTLPNNDGDADQVLKTDGSGGLSWVDQPAGAAAASETVAGVIEIATNAEAAAATATNKAIVPSNIASLDLSNMDNTTAGFIADIVTDTTPQLGGPLDTNGQAITSASNGLIEITPNGTGAIKFGGNTNPAEVRFFDEAGTNYVALKAPLDSAISADETFTLPATDGTNGQVLQTNGSGVLSFVDQSGGGASAPSVTAQNTTATLSTPSAGTLEEVYTVNSSSAVTLTLVSAATVGEGFKYQIKRLGTGSVTVDPASTEYIDHSGQSTFAIGAQYDSITLISDGTNWLLI